MEWKDYADFTVEDFLTDDFFMEWVLHPDTENKLFWEEWQQLYPEKKAVLQEARNIMLSLEYQQHKMPEQSYDRIWHALHEKMDTMLPEPAPTLNTRRFKWYRVASAAAIIALAFASYWWLRPEEKVIYTSTFGESKKITLPDSTVVILAPHSQLHTSVFHSAGKKREVWLDGEAYFIVKEQTTDAAAFTVHAGPLNIEVLGTEFNVNNYNGRTSVVLESGKIALQDVKRQQARIIMEPGEMVAFRKGEKNYTKERVKPIEYITWLQHELAFDRATLEEVAIELYRRFGIRLQFADPALEQELFSIKLKQPDYNLALEAIQEAFSLQLSKQDDSTYLLSR
ncbi:FecR domain-containing protein [Chitinophaga pendula]|uniref:FecR family protein n=1 Tax=Chitinophaga TaxID=79328 RepID=UPI000BAFA89B|nr:MULTISPECIES: FecR domain-containing protein [Chitinophaga]ASZ11061.1 hypothetical protein CK934_08855 [Chitinophaga sp. MD30]UCJ05941.1 FecR domain-containing protein [Chitinophaga pendula]